MIYKIDANLFQPKDVFECGQCFRWNKNENGSYTGIVDNCVLNVEKQGDKIVFIGQNVDYKKCCTDDCNINDDSKAQSEFETMIKKYFDLDRDYSKIKNELAAIDENMKTSIQYGEGIRILNQNLWETIISFIISANNNIPRIKGIIDRISKKYGKKIEADGKEYFTFPTPEQLSKATVEDLRDVGLGFRDVRIYETTKMVLEKQVDLDKLKEMSTQEARNQLLTLSGVGPKVADCILLFSTLKRFDVFPIDVWVRRVMNDLYIHNPNEEKVNKKEIQNIANEKFGNLQGIAQQYLFYWKREA